MSISLIEVQAPVNKTFKDIHWDEDITMTTKDIMGEAKQVMTSTFGAFVSTSAIDSMTIDFSQGLAGVNKEQRPFDSTQSASRLYIGYAASEVFNHSAGCGLWFGRYIA